MKNGTKHRKKAKALIYQLPKKRAATLVLTSVGISGFIIWLCYSSWKALPMMVPIGGLYGWLGYQGQVVENRQTMRLHFRDFLTAVHMAVRSGYSLENAVRSGHRDVLALYGPEDPLVRELHSLIQKMEYQVSVEKLFRDLAGRTGIEEIASFAELVMITKRTGGNMGKALGDTWRILNRRMDTENEIATLVAARKYEQSIMSLVPAGIILYLRFSFPGFMDSLYGNMAGAAVMTAALILYMAAFVLGRKMVRIEV